MWIVVIAGVFLAVTIGFVGGYIIGLNRGFDRGRNYRGSDYPWLFP